MWSFPSLPALLVKALGSEFLQTYLLGSYRVQLINYQPNLPIGRFRFACDLSIVNIFPFTYHGHAHFSHPILFVR